MTKKITDKEVVQKLFSSREKSELSVVEKKESLNTGIKKIDDGFGFPTGYYVILGNPGTGKSWFALWLSRMFYRHNQKRSVYFTLEMPEPIVRQRVLQQWSDLTKTEIEGGKSTQQAIDLLASDVIVVDDFYTEDTRFQTPNTFRDWIESYYNIGYRVFHFDHLHELAGANDNTSNQKVTDSWAKTFQKICKDFPDIWLIIYAQPNGAAGNKKVLRRTDISGSKAITQKCDYCLSLNRAIEIDEKTGLIEINDSERNIILYLDKTRYTESVHIAFRLYFSKTGNFYSMAEGDENANSR